MLLSFCKQWIRKLIKEIDDIFELDQVTIFYHFFFKYSTCGREDFAKVTEITSTLSSHLEKHCTSRRISLFKVLVKLVEQFDNLKQYFLNTLPILPSQNSMEREESLPPPGINELENILLINVY